MFRLSFQPSSVREVFKNRVPTSQSPLLGTLLK
nr:MAG TPA: hypothetical protein [Crassvirales sp.]DAG98063.1 MAG TPA: hypothetical protein [Crassvirales sp.]